MIKPLLTWAFIEPPRGVTCGVPSMNRHAEWGVLSWLRRALRCIVQQSGSRVGVLLFVSSLPYAEKLW